MKQLSAIVLVVVISTVCVAQDKKSSGAAATIKLLIPERPTKTEVTIEGKKQTEPDGVKDGVRVFTTPDLEQGKTYAYTIEALLIPNNYTKIFRKREITFKAGDTVTVDVRTEDKAAPDRIEVRWVPTPKTVVDEMCKLAKTTKDDVVHDYGCGDAIMLIRAVKNFSAKKGFGNDIDQKMVDVAKEEVKKAGLQDRIKIEQGDILKMTEKDCGEATVVLLYIGDDLGAKLGPVLQKALKPGARVVSHRFKLGDWKPEKTIEINAINDLGEMEEFTLHLWIVPEKDKKK